MAHTQERREKTMSYEKACEILRFTSSKSVAAKARLAESAMSRYNSKTPLRYKVACQVLIDAAK